MDVKSLNRTVLISSSILYSVNIILSVSLYTALNYISLPVSNLDLRSILISVPLISGVFNGIILAMITMSLKYAEYYGIGKSALAIVIYSGYWLAFKPPLYILDFMISIMVLCVLQIIDLYLYAKLQKEMFG
ncbi:hypothetical protein DFR86_03890 [Acidianus sulfidivorans JP7]|uniref:Uncharacterized protein n=1 Tax=Acidianus sulfidivorans JP7 TaxID=619593 RepID=A0A2U9IL91_9CREN|nr:hypothetical protein [Acidianus sulfidivorans]AWR96781.1 hypothetical protein DFR86_03890 [Acidianus sulfidivorans JP7]